MTVIDRDEVLKIAGLARLSFDPEALDQFAGQFRRILDYIEKLKEVDVEGIEPTSHVSLPADSGTHALREDRVRPSLSAAEALSNAPDPGCGQFRVPRVIPSA